MSAQPMQGSMAIDETREALDANFPGRLALLLIPVCRPEIGHTHPARDGERPCVSPGKRPLGKAWNSRAVDRYLRNDDRQRHLDEIASHVAAGGNVGWTIPPGVLVLDADSAESTTWMARANPDAPLQGTNSGSHIFVKAPAGVDLNAEIKVEIIEGIKVDLRVAEKSQVVVEPSRHVSGGVYAFTSALPEDLDDLPACPPLIVEAIKASRKADLETKHHDLDAEFFEAGGRNDALFRLGCRLRRGGLSEAELRDSLNSVNKSRCRPPLDQVELEQIASSAAGYETTPEATETNTDEPSKDPISVVSSILGAVFVGPRLAGLAERPAPPPTFPLHPPRGHFSATVGPSFVGKSSVAYWQAMSRASGVAPWSGAPNPEPSKTLIFSPDEPVEAVARRIKSLALTHPAGPRFDYFASISVLGLDESVDSDLLEGLLMDDDGFTRWSNMLDALRPECVVIDAYGDVLPYDVSENDNDHARRVGRALESLAVRHGLAINVLHHVGKLPPGTATTDIDVRDLGRGASALAQKARAVFTFEELKGQNHLRRSRARVNGGATPASIDIEVCATGLDRQEIVFFKTHDPLAHYAPSQFLEAGDWISTTQLARRLDQHLNPREDRDPPGPMRSLAGELRGEWARAGLVSVRDGARNSKEMTLGTA